MKLRTLLIINAIVLGGSGISAVLLPERVCSLYGVAVTSEVTMMAQYAGLGSIAIALVAWFNRNVEDSRALRAITKAFVITYVVGFIISVHGAISGIMKHGLPRDDAHALADVDLLKVLGCTLIRGGCPARVLVLPLSCF